MFTGTTFNFSQPFCGCKVLNIGWGLSTVSEVDCITFQCQNEECMTTIIKPLKSLNVGFEFYNLPRGVSIGGKAGGETEETPALEQSEPPVLEERDNVIYGPWSGSDTPYEE